jgi:hypothetical protein
MSADPDIPITVDSLREREREKERERERESVIHGQREAKTRPGRFVTIIYIRMIVRRQIVSTSSTHPFDHVHRQTATNPPPRPMTAEDDDALAQDNGRR